MPKAANRLSGQNMSASAEKPLLLGQGIALTV
jgi:hypothetical protein